MIAQTTALKPAETKTCSQCPNFNNHLYSKSKGWCELFNLPARSYHAKTNDCIHTSKTVTAESESNLDDIFANYSSKELEALREEAFPTKIIWVDDRGYPMGEETVENGYFSTDFVTYPNEPF